MIVYLLKSGICLVAIFLFYKLFLERENFHVFKRFYLIGGLVLAFIIPLITFTTIVEVEPSVFTSNTYPEIAFEPLPMLEVESTSINYWPIILWTVYGFGVVLFGLKFLFNLFQIGAKIRRNPKQKSYKFTHVLLQHFITPHTFFSYIFLNKGQYVQNKIPKEVFWHEETHAKQKHSFDVVFVELLQVVFWFNPLLYFIKMEIKLNHEFLADSAVLNKGVSLSAYQEILIAFSSNQTEPQLANALNYSSIKKRFTVMKTKTSKKAVWIKSLILLPLIAMLLFGFSEKVEVEKPREPITSSENLNINQDEIRIHIDENKEVSINNKPIVFNAISTELIKISKEMSNNEPKIFVEIEGHLESPFLDELEKELSKSNLSIYEIKATTLILNEEDKNAFFKGTAFTADSLIYNLKNGEKIVGISKPNKENQDKATPQEISEYNQLAKKYNKQPKDKRVVNLKDLNRLEFIFNKMTVKQKENAESFPNFPPPPTISQSTTQNGKTIKAIDPTSIHPLMIKGSNGILSIPMPYEMKVSNNKQLFPEEGTRVVQGYPTPTPSIPENATPEQKEKYINAIENYKRLTGQTYRTKDGKVIQVIEEDTRVVQGYPTPPPPTPPNPTDHMIEMAKQGALFYYEDKKISSDKAIELTKKNKSINIQILGNGSSKPIVKLSKKPITVKE